MKAKLKVNKNLIVEIEEDNTSEVFEGLSAAQETFEDDKCGHCNGELIRFVVRTDEDKNKYYELHCRNTKCRARLPFGIGKKNLNLYPKRRYDSLSPSEQEKRKDEKAYADEHYGYLQFDGWYKYVAPKK